MDTQQTVLQRADIRPVSTTPRVRLWTTLEQLHVQLQLSPPTATLTIEELEAEVERLQKQRDTCQCVSGRAEGPVPPAI